MDTKIRPLHKNIVFQFEDEVSRKDGRAQFKEETDWGFEISSFDESTKSARWGIVVAKGNEVPDEIKIGMRIFIEKLKWTEGFKLDNDTFWMTNSDQIIAYEEL